MRWRRWGVLGAQLAVAAVATIALVAFAANTANDASTTDTAAAPTPDISSDTSAPAPTSQPTAATPLNAAEDSLGAGESPLLATYYFYWYDVNTGLHLREEDGLPTRPPDDPPPTYTDPDWHARQLLDMTDAGINVVLPVYWGENPEHPWSTEGLDQLVVARSRFTALDRPAPRIGLFYDTSIVRGLDLTDPENHDAYYQHIADFFNRIPEEHWATVNGQPIAWLFLPQDNTFDQGVFDHVYARFEAEFGVRPYVVRATGWNCPTTRGFFGDLEQDCGNPIVTDASYVWGTAQDGMQATDTVASAGPGYDESLIPGRAGEIRPRDEGQWWDTNFRAALDTGLPIVAIETWNEYHEASGIADSVEFGTIYIEATRAILDDFRAGQ